MSDPKFDSNDAHKFFAADCFNKAWGLISKEDRTPEDDRQMILLNQASIWHWTQREDCTKRNLSIGYWQAARIHALVGDAESARKAAMISKENTSEEEPFFLGYAYEALARAELVAGNRAEASEQLEQARVLAEKVTEAEDKKWLVTDLDELAAKLG